jgi:hypothetical protein
MIDGGTAVNGVEKATATAAKAGVPAASAAKGAGTAAKGAGTAAKASAPAASAAQGTAAKAKALLGSAGKMLTVTKAAVLTPTFGVVALGTIVAFQCWKGSRDARTFSGEKKATACKTCG